MRAVVLSDTGVQLDHDYPEPRVGDLDVLVEVTGVGICGSDLAEIHHGPIMRRPDAAGSLRPVVMGHEFAGVVAALGRGVSGLEVGAPVVCGAGVSCGSCRMCRRGRTNLCESYLTLGFHADGGLAEFCAAPASTLVDASSYGLPPDTLALTQPMAVARHAVQRSGLAAGDIAVVVGIGGIGTFITYAAAQVGAEVWAVDLDHVRLATARRLGAAVSLNAATEDLAARLDDAGQRAAVLFEVSGTTKGLKSVFSAAAPGATIVPVGIHKTPWSTVFAEWTLREYNIVGTVAHVCAEDIPDSLRLLAARGEGWGDLAPDLHTLESLVAAGFEPAPLGDVDPVKVLVDPSLDRPRPARTTP